jgi:Zn-dependent protease
MKMFNFGLDKRTIYIILAVIICYNILTLGTNGVISILLTLPGVLIALSFHEFAHAWMAVKLGDETPKMQGRLSVDPLKHVDLFGMLMLVFCHIGWGKPVEINSNNFKSKYRNNGEALVALAGPVMNFILALILSIVLGAMYKFTGYGFYSSTFGQVIESMIYYAIIMNVGLGVFNLIPLPPLDGSKIFIRFMPYKVRNFIYNNEQWFYILFLALWITGLASIIISPIINVIVNLLLKIMTFLFGLI